MFVGLCRWYIYIYILLQILFVAEKPIKISQLFVIVVFYISSNSQCIRESIKINCLPAEFEPSKGKLSVNQI